MSVALERNRQQAESAVPRGDCFCRSVMLLCFSNNRIPQHKLILHLRYAHPPKTLPPVPRIEEWLLPWTEKWNVLTNRANFTQSQGEVERSPSCLDVLRSKALYKTQWDTAATFSKSKSDHYQSHTWISSEHLAASTVSQRTSCAWLRGPLGNPDAALYQAVVGWGTFPILLTCISGTVNGNKSSIYFTILCRWKAWIQWSTKWHIGHMLWATTVY